MLCVPEYRNGVAAVIGWLRREIKVFQVVRARELLWLRCYLGGRGGFVGGREVPTCAWEVSGVGVVEGEGL